MKRTVATFESEAAMCDCFIAALPKGWTAYPETAGFDILLAHTSGIQVGIEAKLTLNAEVIHQAVGYTGHWHELEAKPDFKAILVPYGRDGALASLCSYLQITVLTIRPARPNDWGDRRYKDHVAEFRPDLPIESRNYWGVENHWYDQAPAKRCRLPDYVPDVGAGKSAPLKLTDWKIRAIKLSIMLERRGCLTRHDFKHLDISSSRWTQGGHWLAPGQAKGQWIRGPYFPDFRAQHPTNYTQIEADYDKWAPPLTAIAGFPPAKQEPLL